MSTPIGKFIIAKRVHDTSANLVELRIVFFDVIMDMNLLAPFCAMIDFFN